MEFCTSLSIFSSDSAGRESKCCTRLAREADFTYFDRLVLEALLRRLKPVKLVVKTKMATEMVAIHIATITPILR